MIHKKRFQRQGIDPVGRNDLELDNMATIRKRIELLEKHRPPTNPEREMLASLTEGELVTELHKTSRKIDELLAEYPIEDGELLEKLQENSRRAAELLGKYETNDENYWRTTRRVQQPND